MINGKRVLAFIPARGGSKRLPRKNILPLAGKPLIAWSIEAAAKSDFVDDVIVSTDDTEIAEVAVSFGALVPELRPVDLSTDTTSSESVLFYILEKYRNKADIIVLLQPTSPLRQTEHIDEAITLLERKNAFSIVSVTPCEHPPQWANVLPLDNSMKGFIRQVDHKRSQDLGEYYRLNGALYVYDIEKLLLHGRIDYREDTYAYKMDNIYSVDIDNSIDMDMAEFFMCKINTQ
ncbi:acylneuraminate cytidylyltransferase family protein [Vibrio cholerae]|uniref:acylneuraminate cytidylyltransferase family protein n=3 Tax=Vibrio cholerae TaxID=666 RepID=UPI002272200E|nr:acylneuraminate cytidylyltransferase family protein [Vibrio cholerae]MCX9520920.1 acylneuraminate cytidylyltransferase family protein [Vibrio cholerae]